MIIKRQIDTNNQYGLKQDFLKSSDLKNSLQTRIPYQQGEYTLASKNLSTSITNSNPMRTSFKGMIFDIRTFQRLFMPPVKKVPRKLTERVFKSLEQLSEEQVKYYNEIRKKYVTLIKTNSEVRKKLGFPDSVATNISTESLYYIPKKKIFHKFTELLFAPVDAVIKPVKRLFVSKEKLAEINNNEKIIKDFSSLEGLIRSHEIWENGYRKASGNPKWTNNSEFLIPEDVLLGKIGRRRKKFVDPEKGQFSMNSLMLGNRLISGIIYSYFLGTDAYNTTMRYSNDKHEASIQRNSRIAQEFSRIGMNMYIQNLLNGTFEVAVNKSLPTALFVSGSTTAFSEILGRKLVGRPIVPSNKETLDKLEQEMQEKKGILPAIGRLLTNSKKKVTPKQNNNLTEEIAKKIAPSIKPNLSIYKDFAATSQQQSFKGRLPIDMKHFYKTEKLINKEDLNAVLSILKEADSMEYKSIKEILQKAFEKSEFFQNFKKEFLTQNPNNEAMFEDIESILKIENLKEIPLGDKKAPWGQFTKSVLVPVYFVKNLIKNLINETISLYRKITNTTTSHKIKKMKKLLNSKKEEDILKINQFRKEYYEPKIKLKAWKEANLSEDEKMVRLYEEYLSNKGKDAEEIEGAKNIILWLGNQIKKKNIKIQPDGTLKEEDLNKVKKIMQEAVMKADGSKHVEYDANSLNQINMNLSRFITMLFLVTDAYNLTMQYSNDNKKDANKSAKNRAAQEISRISVTAYIMAFFHNLLGHFFNSSLPSALTMTALTSSINDSLSRKVVGVPLLPKDQQQLQAIDEKNTKSANPIKKALAYSIGKKSALPQAQGKDAHLNFDSFFMIKPEIK